jgi:TonB family protein
MPVFIGFEDADPAVDCTTPKQSRMPTGQSPVANMVTGSDLLRCGEFDPPPFIGFEDTAGYLAYTTPEQPVTANQQFSIRWIFFSIGLHLALISLLLSERTIPQTVLPFSVTPIVFEPADTLLAARTSLSERGGSTVEEDRPDAGDPGRLKGHVPPSAVYNISNKNAAVTPPQAPMPTSLIKRNPSAPILGQAVRNEYLIYLIRRIGVLPFEVVGDRHGDARLSVLARGDGEITRVSILRGSGYPDIDLRVQKMVAAVGRLPPAPAGEIRNSSGQFQLTLEFRFGRFLTP